LRRIKGEYIACYEATRQTIWLKNFIPGLKVVDCISRPLILHCDYVSNNKSSATAKHIDIKYYVVKNRIQDQTIGVKHISTTRMLADPLLKGLSPSVFHEDGAGMGLLKALGF
jgi:hypothetical protein